ncbi:unnamed protein product [Pedinophyceae sp. YPF-701]|nr:unnamed protein product [Pedinophyceae sp. YPF-701]
MGAYHERPTDQAPLLPGDAELKDTTFVDVVEKLSLPQVERTLALIKPDAVAQGNAQEIMSIIRHKGFTIIEQKRLQLSQTRAEEFYKEHRDKPFFAGLVEFMTSGPIYALCLSKMNAISDWRECMGPTNSDKARIEFPRSIRALYGTDGRRNAAHGSDSKLSAYREVKFFFPKLYIEPPRDQTWAKEYIEAELVPVLTKGLVELGHTRPTANKLEAVVWLADWLEHHNPNKAQLVVGREEMPLGKEEVDAEEEFAAAELAQADSAQPEEGEATRAEAQAAAGGEGADDAAELEAAATKIQATFRGMQDRKKVEELKRAGEGEGEEGGDAE